MQAWWKINPFVNIFIDPPTCKFSARVRGLELLIFTNLKSAEDRVRGKLLHDLGNDKEQDPRVNLFLQMMKE